MFFLIKKANILIDEIDQYLRDQGIPRKLADVSNALGRIARKKDAKKDDLDNRIFYFEKDLSKAVADPSNSNKKVRMADFIEEFMRQRAGSETLQQVVMI